MTVHDFRDLGDEKPVLDGTEWIPGQQTDGTTFHTPASALGGVGPFTDGDGNVYSIEYDADAKTLSLKCVDGDSGAVQTIAVGPQGEVDVRMHAISVDELVEVKLLAGLTGVDITYTTDAGITASRLQVDGSGVSINNVVIDPTAPWPGG